MKQLSSLFIFAVISFLWIQGASADVILGAAGEYRFERGMDQNVETQTYYNFFGEYQWDVVYLGAEYFFGQPQTSGQQTLNFSRTRQGGWLTIMLPAGNWGYVSPYLSGGFGGYQDTVTTTFIGVPSTEISRTYMTGFGGLGIRQALIPYLFLALEGRVIFGENQDPQPTMATSLRIGVQF